MTWCRVDRTRRYAWEIQAEVQAIWSHRLRARWFYQPHAVDNFILPNSNVTLRGLLRANGALLTAQNVSLIRVPTIQSFREKDLLAEGKNILQRFNTLGEPLSFGNWRHTLLGNPRRVVATWVHWGNGMRAGWELGYEEAYEELGLQTLHVMGAAGGRQVCGWLEGGTSRAQSGHSRLMHHLYVCKCVGRK